MRHLRRLLREPLLHFLVLGGLLFAVYAAANRAAPREPGEIVVDRARLASLVAQFERLWQRPPTPAERSALIEGFVREEVLVREGLALGLDRDDPVVRRRIAQKLSFLADAETDTALTEDDLEAWLRAHPADYRIETRFTLRHVLFDPARRGAGLEADLVAARAALEGGGAVPGDATLLPPALEAARRSEVESVFGADFAAALEGLPVGGWQGPIRSAYGVHLVELRAREEGRVPALAEVRSDVERDLLRARAEAASDAFYRRLRERYTLRIEEGS